MNICIDSRLCQSGDLFFALPGERVDGHQFLQDVQQKGAIAAIVQKGKVQPHVRLDQFEVEDVLSTLQQLARSRISSYPDLTTIGITGSLGKTTTRFFLNILLKEHFSLAASSKNYNSQIGLPLTILNELKGDKQLLLLEMAMTSKNEIANLVTIAPPHIAVLTPIDYVHAQSFSSLQEIAAAKAEIYSTPHTQRLYLPKNIAHREYLESLASCPIFYYSENEITEKTDGLYFRGIFLGKIQLPAPYLKLNLAAALSVAIDLGVPDLVLRTALQNLSFPPGRLEKVEIGGIHVINDAYNASGMRIAIEALVGDYIAVLGSIPDLGPYSEKIHEESAVAALSKIKTLYTIGEEAKVMHQCWIKNGRLAYHFDSIDPLCAHLFPSLKKGDELFIKGKNTLALGQIVNKLKEQVKDDLTCSKMA